MDARELQREWDEAVQALKAYSATQRDQALASARDLLQAMDRRIDDMESRAADEWSGLSEALRERRKAAMQELRQQRKELSVWYGGMRHTSANAWDEVRQGFIEAYGSLSNAFDRAMSEFRESRTPPAESTTSGT
jgi:hypothetical protein